MTVEIECMRCEHVATVEGAGAADGVLRAGVFRCDECGARMAYGELMPRVVVSVEPPHFVTIQIDGGPTYKLDAQYAAAIARDILSVALPR